MLKEGIILEKEEEGTIDLIDQGYKVVDVEYIIKGFTGKNKICSFGVG